LTEGDAQQPAGPETDCQGDTITSPAAKISADSSA